MLDKYPGFLFNV